MAETVLARLLQALSDPYCQLKLSMCVSVCLQLWY